MNQIRYTSAAVVFVVWIGSLCLGADIRVPDDHSTIQAAIDAANEEDVIIVAPGLYVENLRMPAAKGLVLTSMDPTDSDTVAATIIDGNGIGPCVEIGNGSEQFVVAGFTITGGIGTRFGGGIYSRSSIMICGNVIMHSKGGGIAAERATIVSNTVCYNVDDYGEAISSLRHSSIVGNFVHNNAGASGIGIGGSSNVVSGNTLVGNDGMDGGGICCSVGEANIVSCNRVVGNRAYFGGGVMSRASSGVMIVGNLIADNKAYLSDTETEAGGGGIACEDSSPIIIGNIIVRNEAQWGGGIFCKGAGSKLTIMNNLIAGNKAAVVGGGVALRDGAAPFLTANTMVLNRSKQYAGGVGAVKGQASLVDCILWGNSAPTGAELMLANTANVTVKHCNIAGGQSAAFLTEGCTLAWGAGNIDADPLFVDTGRWDDAGTPGDASDDVFILGDYRLLPGSPCIDAGTNDVDNPATPDVEALPDMDLAGIARIIDGDLDGTATIDIGAYEYLPGDVNYDGKVNILDLISVRNSLGKDAASDPAARRCDVNNDGAVNVLDVIAVRNRLK